MSEGTAVCTRSILRTVDVLTGTPSSGGWYGRGRWNRSVSSGSLPGEGAHSPGPLFFSLAGALLIRRPASQRGVVVGEAGRPAESRSSKVPPTAGRHFDTYHYSSSWSVMGFWWYTFRPGPEVPATMGLALAFPGLALPWIWGTGGSVLRGWVWVTSGRAIPCLARVSPQSLFKTAV